MAFARGTQQVGAPHEQVARPVVGVVGVFATHAQRTVLERLHRVVLGVHAGGLRVLDQLQRVGLQLRRTGQPAHALGAHVVVDQAAAELRFVGQRREDFLDAELFVAPLVGVGIEEAGAVHLARRTHPVQRESQRGPAGLRAQLFLAHVVRPAAAALADAAAHHQHVDDAAVVHVAVVPVVHRRADDDHGLAFGLVGVVGELARHRDHLVALDAGDLLLPGRRVGQVLVVVGGGVLARQATRHAVVGHRQVEHRGDQGVALFTGLAQLDAAHRHLAHDHAIGGVGLLVGLEVGRVVAAEIREGDLAHFVLAAFALHQAELELDLVVAAGFLVFEVPLAEVVTLAGAPAEADGAVGQHDLVGLVDRDGLPLGVVLLAELAVEVAGAQVAAGYDHGAAVGQGALFELHQVRHVGIATHVVVEIRRALVEIELFEDHMAHGHGDRRVGALLGVHPQVAQLADLGVVGRDRDRLGALVAHLGEEVGVGRAGLGHVGTPGDDVGGVVPIGRFGHVGLLAPDLRTGRRQVAVPVVEAHAHATDQRQVARAGRVADHGHGRDRREADHAVGAVFLGGVDVGAGDDLVDLVPAAAHHAAQAALLLPFTARVGVLDDAGPGVDRALGHGQRGAPVLEQLAAHHRVLHPVGAVEVPAVGGAAGAAARLVVGQIGAGARVVGLLGFPGDDAALDVDLPRAGARAVHAVGGAHDLVVRPAVAVGVFPGAVFTRGDAVIAREALFGSREMAQTVEKVAH